MRTPARTNEYELDFQTVARREDYSRRQISQDFGTSVGRS